MAATKIIVNHNGSIRVEGDFEIVDPNGRSVWTGGPDGHWALPMRPLGKQAFLRRVPQDVWVCRYGCCSRTAGPQAKALTLLWSLVAICVGRRRDVGLCRVMMNLAVGP